jgi:hypothetical protein
MPAKLGLAMAAILLALVACTRMYFKEFAVEPQDRAYTARAQFADIKAYVVSRGLRVVTESEHFIAVELEAGDNLQVRLLPEQKVELTLARRSSAADFPAGQLRTFQETLASRLRERTGQVVSIRLVDERVSPVSNVRFQ